MGIVIRVTMAWKMLCVCQNSSALHTLHKSRCFSCYIITIFSKRAVTYDRIIWIGIDIYNWSEIKMYAKAFAVFTNVKARLFYQLVIFYSPPKSCSKEKHMLNPNACSNPIQHPFQSIKVFLQRIVNHY